MLWFDLIETYWDVKEGYINNNYDNEHRFNRNILGCKGVFLSIM